MGTYTQIIYQIVFATKNRERTLNKDNRSELYKYIHGILQQKKCHPYQIGGISDHLHILTHLHPSVSLAALVKDIKLASNNYIKRKKLFPYFSGWQSGYGAFTYSFKEKDRLIRYIMNQEGHHHQKSFKEELGDLLNKHGIEFNEEYLL